MASVCFIVEELFPQDLGGIARLMHNIFHHAKLENPAAQIHVAMTYANVIG